MSLSDFKNGNETDRLAHLRTALIEYPIYSHVNDLRSTQIFMEFHVFAVWDFMSLLKRLQMSLTGSVIPWLPAKDRTVVRFINQIVLGEESDHDGQGGFCSHFEVYVSAMKQIGADTSSILGLVEKLRSGWSFGDVIASTDLDPGVRQFLESTMRFAIQGGSHEVAAAFFYGREDVIPEMFQKLLLSLSQQTNELDRLIYYVERHIEVDGGEHSVIAKSLLQNLIGSNKSFERQANLAAIVAIESRIKLWDAALAAIERSI